VRYVIDTGDDTTITLFDLDDDLVMILRDGDVAESGLKDITVRFSKNGLDELLRAIELIKALRPKDAVNVPPVHPGGLVKYPPGTRSVTNNQAREEAGYTATSHADNPNG
jgi:hypothetical protein